MSGNREKGILGENTACNYLQDAGYVVLQRNFRNRFGEIDIVARDGRYICFIEVKTRKSTNFGKPREAVDGYKQSRIKNIAQLFLAQKRILNSSVRFDVVEVLLDEKDNIKSVILIKNAFD
jgi:putative endonuclease